MGDSEQKLIDLTFEMLMSAKNNLGWFSHATREEVAEWARRNFADSGFPVEAVGCSWGMLINNKPKAPTISRRRMQNSMLPDKDKPPMHPVKVRIAIEQYRKELKEWSERNRS